MSLWGMTLICQVSNDHWPFKVIHHELKRPIFEMHQSKGQNVNDEWPWKVKGQWSNNIFLNPLCHQKHCSDIYKYDTIDIHKCHRCMVKNNHSIETQFKSWVSNLLCQGPLNHWAFFQLDPNRWLTITHLILPGDKNKHYELVFLLIYYYTLNFVLFARLEYDCFRDTHITVWNTNITPLNTKYSNTIYI